MRFPAIFLLAALILAAGYGLIQWLPGHSESVSTRPSPPEPEPAPSPARAPRVVRVAPSGIPSPVPASLAPPKPEGNVIAFRVVNGLAIAYGDLVLGKPEAGSQADHGYYDAPTPQLWDRPEIPYQISADLPDPSRVEKAIEYFRQYTPVRFVPFQGQHDAVIFEPGTEHCYSSLGRMGGLQSIRLSPECRWPEIVHEMMHALGFIHEQSRPDRDRYVDVQWANIEETYRPQFAVVPETFASTVRGFAFDYHSAMLYRPNAFAIDLNQLTLRSLTDQLVNPVPSGLSEGDIRRLNHLYNLYE